MLALPRSMPALLAALAFGGPGSALPFSAVAAALDFRGVAAAPGFSGVAVGRDFRGVAAALDFRGASAAPGFSGVAAGLDLGAGSAAQQSDTVVRMVGPPRHAGTSLLVEELSIAAHAERVVRADLAQAERQRADTGGCTD